MKILNLYAGIGGNRKLWKNVEVTAIENNPEIAKIYQTLFPQDKVIITDAHQYLLEHYKEFNFIWSSPPCQTHSSFRFNIGVKFRRVKPEYPDMRLYQEIIFLQTHAKCKWVVENVKPYYKPLIKGKLLQRHIFWSNFEIPDLDSNGNFINFKKECIRTSQISELQKIHDTDLSCFKLKNKRQVLRNCVLPQIGKHVLECSNTLQI